MTNPNSTKVNPTMTTEATKVAVAPRNPSQVADTEVRGATAKGTEVGRMVEEEEINVLPHSLSFWLGILRWPLLDGSQTQGGYGADQGSGYGTGGGDSNQCQSYDGYSTVIFINHL